MRGVVYVFLILLQNFFSKNAPLVNIMLKFKQGERSKTSFMITKIIHS